MESNQLAEGEVDTHCCVPPWNVSGIKIITGAELPVPEEAARTNVYFRLTDEVNTSSNKIFTGNSWPETGFFPLYPEKPGESAPRAS